MGDSGRAPTGYAQIRIARISHGQAWPGLGHPRSGDLGLLPLEQELECEQAQEGVVSRVVHRASHVDAEGPKHVGEGEGGAIRSRLSGRILHGAALSGDEELPLERCSVNQKDVGGQFLKIE